MRWDLFCRVIDNYGDLGVCRRLAADLQRQGQAVRLWVDDAALAQRMADPQDGVALVHWTDPAPDLLPGDVVVEAFACDPPERFVRQMALRRDAGDPPVWINLEYLSAQDYVARSHGLPSPQLSGPGQGLMKWFFFPGFTPQTGGLIREEGLLESVAAFDRTAWLAQWGPVLRPGESVVSLFAYPGAPLEALLHGWAQSGQPIWLLVTHGPLQERARQWWSKAGQPDFLRLTDLPWLHHREFDHLLWSCDLNLVRGEDSLVRALWAGQPFLWQLYPQADGAHGPKLEAFLNTFIGPYFHPVLEPPGKAPLESCPEEADWAGWCRAWNGLSPWPNRTWPLEAGAAGLVSDETAQPASGAPDLPTDLRGAVRAWRNHLSQQPSLTRQLIDFATQRLPR